MEINKTGNVRTNAAPKRFRATKVAVEKAVSIQCSGSVCVALVVQHVNRMRRIILSSVDLLGSTKFFHIIS